MGLGNLIDDDVKTEENSNDGHALQRYGDHERDEFLEEAVEELSKLFPVHPEIEFIEVSPRMSKTPAKLYTQEREDGTVTYIRVSEPFTNRTDAQTKQALLYLLVQAYFKEIGLDHISPANDEFKWVCGQVGAPTNPIDTNEPAWQLACATMLDEDSGLTELDPSAHLDDFIEGNYELTPDEGDGEGDGEVPPPEDEL